MRISGNFGKRDLEKLSNLKVAKRYENRELRVWGLDKNWVKFQVGSDDEKDYLKCKKLFLHSLNLNKSNSHWLNQWFAFSLI